MKNSHLYKFLSSQLNSLVFKTEIKDETEDYYFKLKIKGSSINIRMDEDEEFIFTKGFLIKMLDSFLNGELNPTDFAYIADFLSLSDTITIDDETRDALDSIVENVTNNDFSLIKVQNLKEELS